MNQVAESGEDDDGEELRFSNGSAPSYLFPTNRDGLRKTLSYDELHWRPLRLSVLKLDGSSFEIKVAKSGKVGEVKKAVESAFRHLPQNGPDKVSWKHVWGQFCLCHEGQKLLTDSDYLSPFNIKDGDQLEFVHHASNTLDLTKMQQEREDSDSDIDRPSSSGEDSKEEAGHNKIEFAEKIQDGNASANEDDVLQCRNKLSNFFFGCFSPYQRLPSYSSHREMGDNDRSALRRRRSFSVDRLDYRKETCKGM